MAEKNSITEFEDRQKLIAILRMVRASGDLLTAAMDSVSEGRSVLHEATLVDLGSHLEDLASNGLVILRYDGPAQPLITETETFKKLEEAAESQAVALKLSDYSPGLANAKVSVIAMWKALDRLDDMADDPGKVKNWLMKIHDELQQCQVA